MFNFEDTVPSGAQNITFSLRAARQTAEALRRDIFDSHRHRVFALSYYMTGNEVEAEDILTETFVGAFERAEEPAREDVDAALVGQLRTRFPLGQDEAPAVASPEHTLTGRNVRRTDLEEAIQFLPATERLLFLMRDVEGYSVEAIAKAVEMPESAISRSLFSARIRMRALLAKNQPTAV